ncbi:hypothetical protein EYF80_046825 [Liparis tanakae]|uniref:Uncharacterized protein n=1 Tax=Liparis tanakae TaxID=230148 RepID=A0A4Z2FPJ4_9TELE|nr:hypothetical protein EYF80_046825 [Liparis tanakae]
MIFLRQEKGNRKQERREEGSQGGREESNAIVFPPEAPAPPTWTHLTLIPGQTNFFHTSVALASPQVTE